MYFRTKISFFPFTLQGRYLPRDCNLSIAITQEDPNVSTIIYVNRDREGEENSDEVGDCFSLRRFKKPRTNSNENRDSRRKSWMEKIIFKQSRVINVEEKTNTYLDSLYPLRNVNPEKIDNSQMVKIRFHQIIVKEFNVLRQF